jgi:RNA polymerase sigma factor (sigma-70 family)
VITGPDDPLAEAFEAQRERLVSLATRILGSSADAEDAVQEAWFRLARQDAAAVENLGGWLTTVVGRVCIDVLRSRKKRAEVPLDEQVPQLVATEDPAAGPEDEALVVEALETALMVVLDTLRPTERVALVLHDVFAVPFDEVGQIICSSGDAAKVLTWRARRKLRSQPAPASTGPQHGLVDVFMAAARAGDFDGLVRVLDPDATLLACRARRVMARARANDVAA